MRVFFEYCEYLILRVWNFLGVVVMILLVPLNAYVASKIQKLQKEQMANKDERTKLMTEILSGNILNAI